MNDPAAADEFASEPTRFLDELRDLRRATRTDRHAFWLPLLIFGALTCASAPMYINVSRSRPTGLFYESTPHLAALGGFFIQPGSTSSNVRGFYWLMALLIGTLVTAIWYSWHAAISGVATRVHSSLALWIGGAVALTLVSTFSLELVFRAWTVTSRGTSALLVIAIGLIALTWVERSWLLAAICALYTVAALIGVFYNPENQLFRLLSSLGVSNGSLPYDDAGTINVLLPGVVLLAGGFIAVLVDLRRR